MTSAALRSTELVLGLGDILSARSFPVEFDALRATANAIGWDPRQRWRKIIMHELFVLPTFIEFEQVSGREVIATHPDTGIAISDDSEAEALDSLMIVLRETLEDFRAEEDNLGPGPERQLRILRTCLKL